MPWSIVLPIAGAALGGLLSDKGGTNVQGASTLTPDQQKALSQLLAQLNIPGIAGGTNGSLGPNSDLLGNIEKTSLAGLEQYAMGIMSGTGPTGQSSKFLESVLTPDQGKLNELFTTGVENPTLDAFQKRVIPQLTARFGGNAAFGTDKVTQTNNLTKDLMDSLTAGRANFVSGNLNTQVKAADTLNQTGNAGIQQLVSALGVSPQSLNQMNMQQQNQIKLLLSALGTTGTENIASVTPGTDYSTLGYLLGKGAGQYASTGGAGGTKSSLQTTGSS